MFLALQERDLYGAFVTNRMDSGVGFLYRSTKGIIRKGNGRVARALLMHNLTMTKTLNKPCSACPGLFEGHLLLKMAVLFRWITLNRTLTRPWAITDHE